MQIEVSHENAFGTQAVCLSHLQPAFYKYNPISGTLGKQILYMLMDFFSFLF